MKITNITSWLVEVPQKPPIAPYQSRYRATSEKESLLVRLETDTGLAGWGETPVDWINKSFAGNPEELLRAADEAMYAAKASARATVEATD